MFNTKTVDDIAVSRNCCMVNLKKKSLLIWIRTNLIGTKFQVMNTHSPPSFLFVPSTRKVRIDGESQPQLFLWLFLSFFNMIFNFQFSISNLTVSHCNVINSFEEKVGVKLQIKCILES